MGGNIFILSSAHTEDEINQTVKALGDTLNAIITEGILRQG